MFSYNNNLMMFGINTDVHIRDESSKILQNPNKFKLRADFNFFFT